jgi:hypothetical protein
LKVNNDRHIIELKESTKVDNLLSYDVIQFVNTQVITKDSFFQIKKEKQNQFLLTIIINGGLIDLWVKFHLLIKSKNI